MKPLCPCLTTPLFPHLKNEMPYSFHNANREKQNRKLGKHALFMYIGKTKPWPAKLSRSKKKKQTKKGVDDEETTAPPPTVPYEPAKERKEEKRK
jgi:hypothetical protein